MTTCQGGWVTWVGVGAAVGTEARGAGSARRVDHLPAGQRGRAHTHTRARARKHTLSLPHPVVPQQVVHILEVAVVRPGRHRQEDAPGLQRGRDEAEKAASAARPTCAQQQRPRSPALSNAAALWWAPQRVSGMPQPRCTPFE